MSTNEEEDLKSAINESTVGTDVLDENLSERIRAIVRGECERKGGICLPTPLCGKGFEHGGCCVRIIWFIIYTTLFVLFFANFFERLCFYRSVPKWTEVYIRAVNFSEPGFRSLFPAVTVCSGSSAKFVALRENLKVEIKKYGLSPTKMLGCLNAISDVIEFPCGNVEDAWEASDLIPDIENCTSDPSKNLEYDIKPLNTPYGKCALIKIKEFPPNFHRFDILFNVSSNACRATKSPTFIHHPDRLPNFGEISALPAINGILEFYPVFKTIKYLSTSNDPCVTNEEFDKCYSECIADKIRKTENITCRFPFFPDSVNLESCNGSADAKTNYSEAVKIYYSLNPITNCPCRKPCEVNLNFYSLQAFLWPRSKWDRQTLLSLVLTNRYATIIEEKFVFDTSSLFAEIGGLFAFVLGFSLLTVFDFVYHGFKCVTSKKVSENYKSDPLYRKVVYLMSECRRKTATQAPPFHTSGMRFCFNSSNILVKIIWCVAFLICFVITIILIFFVINREPIIRNIFHLDYETKLTLPGVALCGQTNKLFFTRKKAAKKLKIGTKDEDLCKLDFIDISVGLSKVADLWSKNNFDDSRYKLNDIGENVAGFPLIKNFNQTVIVLPPGKCTYYSGIHGLGYAQSITIFPMMATRMSQSCVDTADVYFTKISTDDIEFINRYKFRQGGATAFQVFVSKISRLNLTGRKCVDEEIARECNEKCLLGKFYESTLICSLPYMSETSIPYCTKPEQAKETQTEYFKLRYSPTDCDCPLSCNHVYTTVHQGYEVETKKEMAAFISISFGQNYIEEFKETAFANVGKVFCNIGAIVGVFLGFSFFSLIYWFYSILMWLSNRSSYV